MPPMAIAVGGAALIGGAATVAAASSNAHAIQQSTDSSLQANRESLAAQAAALDKQLAFQTDALNTNTALQTGEYNSQGKLLTDIHNQNINVLNPFAQTGYSAMNQINALVGLPEQQGYTPKPITFTPVTAPTVAAPTASAPGAAPLATGGNALIPAYAGGTMWHPGGNALVGENGPEIVNLPQGSQVIPNVVGNALANVGGRLPHGFGINFLRGRHGVGTSSAASTPAPAPAASSGTNALSPQQQALNSFYDTAYYQFPLQQGLDAVNANYSARGLSQSGAAEKALFNYGRGAASAGMGDYLQILGNQQGLGFGAASAETGIGQGYSNSLIGLGSNYNNALTGLNSNYANNVSNAYGNYGNALSQGALNVGNINSNAAIARGANTGSTIAGVGNALGSAAGYFAYQPSYYGGTAGYYQSLAPAVSANIAANPGIF